jgi:ethanolamine utilization protein EutN
VFLARVVGDVVATIKHRDLEGRKLLLVQPVGPDGAPRGARTIAVDIVDAGTGDHVLVVDEGNSAAQALAQPRGPIRTVVVGVVDAVTRE